MDQLDRKLGRYIKKRRGFFVEIGAADGIQNSNTLWFEKYRNWCGILIEANPRLFESCRLNRPRCMVFNYACVDSSYSEKTITLFNAGLMSIVKGAKSENDQKDHLQTAELFHPRGPLCEVPARTLSSIMKECNVIHIDLLVLDVEGYELNVLKGLDFESHSPRFILIEVWDKDRDAILQYLKHWGYTLARVLTDFSFKSGTEWTGSYGDYLFRKK